MKHITKILFGFVCGVFLCVAPGIANAQDDCQNCKDLFNNIGTDPNLCDLGSTSKDQCATITDTLLTICLDSVKAWCAAYRKDDTINADDFCQDTTYCTGGGGTGGGGTGGGGTGGGTGGQCIDPNCNIGQEIYDYGDTVRVDTTSCDASTNWRCDTTSEYYEFATGDPNELCVTEGSCEENGCKYLENLNGVNLNGVVCDGQGGMDKPYCSCSGRDGMLYFRLVCNANTGFDYYNGIITCGENLFCDLKNSSPGICRYKKQCSDCPKISGWTDSDSTGYQVRTKKTCNYSTGQCNIETQEYRCAKGYYGNPGTTATGCVKCPDNATCITGATTFKCNPGYYRETWQATNCATCPVPSTLSGNNYNYSDVTGTVIGVTSCALAVGSTVEDDIGFYEIVNTQCQYQQGK